MLPGIWEGGKAEYLFNGYRFAIWDDEQVLKMYSDVRTTL